MIIKEFRLPLPLTVEEYKIGQLYATAMSSLEETGGGEGVEIIKNEPFDADDPNCSFKPHPLLLGGDAAYRKGQYTYKIFHVESKCPRAIRMIAPKGSLQFHEESWSAYPYCRTVLTNPNFMKGNFKVMIDSMHIDTDTSINNVHRLSEKELSKRQVVYVDVADKQFYQKNEKYDVTVNFSLNTNRGPLSEKNWWKKDNMEIPIMCAYKLVTVEFKWFGLQNAIESYIQNQEPSILQGFQRRVLFWIDEWINMNLDDIRRLEDDIKSKLDHERNSGEKKMATYSYE